MNKAKNIKPKVIEVILHLFRHLKTTQKVMFQSLQSNQPRRKKLRRRKLPRRFQLNKNPLKNKTHLLLRKNPPSKLRLRLHLPKRLFPLLKNQQRRNHLRRKVNKKHPKRLLLRLNPLSKKLLFKRRKPLNLPLKNLRKKPLKSNLRKFKKLLHLFKSQLPRKLFNLHLILKNLRKKSPSRRLLNHQLLKLNHLLKSQSKKKPQLNLLNNHLKKLSQLLKSQLQKLLLRKQFNLLLILMRNPKNKSLLLPKRAQRLPPSLNNHQATKAKSLPLRKQSALSLLLLLSQLLKSNLSQNLLLTKMTNKEFSKFALEDSLSKLMIVISETSSVSAETLLKSSF